MSEKRTDRGLLLVAKADLKLAKVALDDKDPVMINQGLFHVTQAAEKIIKFLCSCYDIDYTYSHFVGELVDKLLDKFVNIPELVQERVVDYGKWAAQSRYNSSQLVQRRFLEKQYECISEWLKEINKQFGIMDIF